MIDSEFRCNEIAVRTRLPECGSESYRTPIFRLLGVLSLQSYRSFVDFASANPTLVSASVLILSIIFLPSILSGDWKNLIGLDVLALFAAAAGMRRRKDATLLSLVTDHPRIILAYWFTLLSLPIILGTAYGDPRLAAAFVAALWLISLCFPIGERTERLN